MKESDREYTFTAINRIFQSLISEAEVLCELIDNDGAFESVSRHISSIEDDADNVKHDIQYYYQDNKLFRDPEALLIYDMVSSIENCTDIIYEISRAFLMLNITSIKDNIVSSFMSAGTGAVTMTGLVNSLRRMDRFDTPIKELIALDNFSVEYKKIYELNMNKLYVDGNDPIEVMRWTYIYNCFKELFEAYEDVAECCGKYCIFSNK